MPEPSQEPSSIDEEKNGEAGDEEMTLNILPVVRSRKQSKTESTIGKVPKYVLTIVILLRKYVRKSETSKSTKTKIIKSTPLIKMPFDGIVFYQEYW